MRRLIALVGATAASTLVLTGCQPAESGSGANLLGTPVEDLSALEGEEFADLTAREIERVVLASRTRTTSQLLLRSGRFEGFVLVWRMRVKRGGNCVATLRQSGRVVRLIRIDDHSWVKGGGDSEDERWIVTEGAGEVCDIGDPAVAIDQLQELRKGGVKSVDGTRAVKLVGVGNDGARVTRLVSLRPPHRVLREISKTEGGTAETTDYGEFNSRFVIAPPPSENVEDPNSEPA